MTTLDSILATYRTSQRALHTLWSDAVGTPGYDKGQWKLLANALDVLAREAATAAGHPHNAPLLLEADHG